MGKFKVICCECGSDKVLEKSNQSKLDSSANGVIYGEGIQRKCIECNNESFIIFKTWQQNNKV